MTYLFLAVPPYSGSTVLHNYIRNCKNVASLTNEFRRNFGDVSPASLVEGNAATKAKSLFGDKGPTLIKTIPGNYLEIIQDPSKYDWVNIRQAWNNNWALTKPNAPVKMQKTPNDTYRVHLMQPCFNAKWIISVREPYAWTQSIIEKICARQIDPSPMAEDIARHVIATYMMQKMNVELLGANAYKMTFEDLVANQQKHIDGLKAFVPELTDLSFTGNIKVKSYTADNLVNNNAERVATFKTVNGAMEKFQSLYTQHAEIIEYWGYKATL
jgi:hypothetical protein